MQLNPFFYTKLIRPRFMVRKYIESIIKENFNFDDVYTLDFGCGTGANSYMFDQNKYLGVDVDEDRILYAKKKFPKCKFDILKNNIIPAENNSFDFICILATIHHISDKDFKSYIEEFSRVLKQNGKLIIIEPCFLKNSFFNNWFMNFFDEGKYIRTEKEYIYLFEGKFEIFIHKRFKKFFFYNEIFFSAKKW